MSAASLVVRITGDLTGFNKSVKDMTKGIRAAALEVATIGAALAPIALVAGELAKLGMESEEVGRRFHETFGSGSAAMQTAIEQLRGSVPETTTELERLASQVNEFAESVNIAAPQAATMTKGLLDMAATISAAKTIPMAEVLQGLESGLMGSTKGLRQFGIDIQKAAVEQEAFRLGIIQSKSDLDAARTAIATYSLLLGPVAQLTNSATKANEDAAQQWRQLKADAHEFAEEIGTLLLPAIHGVIDTLRTLFDSLAHPTWGKWLDEMIVGFDTLTGDMSGAALAQIRLNTALAAAKAPPPAPPGAGSITGGLPPRQLTLESLKADSQSVLQAFNQAKDAGGDMTAVTQRIYDLNKQVLLVYRQQGDKMSEMALEAQKIAHEFALIMSVMGVVGANRTAALRPELSAQQKKDFVETSVRSASMIQASDATVKWNAALAQVSAETQLRFREISVTMIDTFQAGREAAVEFAEHLRKSGNEMATTIASLKTQFAHPAASLTAGATDALAPFMASLGPIAIAATAIGKILQGLQPVLDAVLEPLVSLGQIIGEMLIPVLRPLFESLKALGVVVGIAGEILYRVAQGLANVIGGVIVAIGKMISKIPFLGGVGRDVQHFGQGVLDLANSFGKTARSLGIEVSELEKMKFGDTAAGILGLGQAAQFAANQLTNVPSGYRVALAVFNAMATRSPDASAVLPMPGAAAAGGPIQHFASGAFAPGSIVISGANKSGDDLLTDVISAARRRSQTMFGPTTRPLEVFA